MRAPTWNHRSAVTCCDDCAGTGWVHAHRAPTVNDPYPESRCTSCDGEHAPECPVCGFDQIVRGFDCLACETVTALMDADVAAFDPSSFSKAIAAATAARLAFIKKEAA